MSKQGGNSSAIARVYTHQSKRKARNPGESKTVSKAVLDNPFQIKWPQIPQNVENAILAQVIHLLQGVAEYHLQRRVVARKNKPKRERKRTEKKVAMVLDDAEGNEEAIASSSMPAVGQSKAMETDGGVLCEKTNTDALLAAPEILKDITVGINDVTKRLETQSRVVLDIPTERISLKGEEETTAQTDIESNSVASPSRSPIRAVLVCKADIEPPILINHIPYLVASCNSKITAGGELVRLVSLPKGAELTLAQALGVRRAAVMAIDEGASLHPMLQSLLNSVQPVVAPWIIGPLPTPRKTDADRRIVHNRKELIGTNIRQIQTTAPKDMRQHKARRAKERAETKKRRRERMKKGEEANANVNSNKPGTDVAPPVITV